MKITAELVLSWNPFDRLLALFDRPMSPLEVLTRTDGAWAQVPDTDRLWIVLRRGVIDDGTLGLFVRECLEHAFPGRSAAGLVLESAQGAALAAAWAAAWTDAVEAERRWQVERLVEMLREGGAA